MVIGCCDDLFSRETERHGFAESFVTAAHAECEGRVGRRAVTDGSGRREVGEQHLAFSRLQGDAEQLLPGSIVNGRRSAPRRSRPRDGGGGFGCVPEVFHHEPRLGRLAGSPVAVGRVHARRTGQVETSGSEDIDLQLQRCVHRGIVVQRKNEGHHAGFIAQRR